MKANQTFKINSLVILNLLMGLTSKFGTIHLVNVKNICQDLQISRNRGKTMGTSGYNAVPACTGDKDDVYVNRQNYMHNCLLHIGLSDM